MDDVMIEHHLENLDRRLARVEQILPTLATKDELKTLATKAELQAAVAPLATKGELQAAVALLATKDDLGELRHHMNVLYESLRGDIHMLGAHAASERPKDSEA